MDNEERYHEEGRDEGDIAYELDPDIGPLTQIHDVRSLSKSARKPSESKPIPESQPMEIDDEEEEPLELPRMPQRSNASIGTPGETSKDAPEFKSPEPIDHYWEDYDGDHGQPDLVAYFAQVLYGDIDTAEEIFALAERVLHILDAKWDIPWKDIVLMCRAYASYITAANRPTAEKEKVEAEPKKKRAKD